MSLQDMKRIKSTYDEEQVNTALGLGWQLIGTAAGKDESGWPIQKFTLGHPLTKEEAAAARESTEA